MATVRKALYWDGQFVRYVIEREPPAKPSVVEVLEVAEDDEPSLSGGQKVVVDTILDNGKHRIRKQAVTKTQAEKDAEADAADNATEAQAIRGFYNSIAGGNASDQQVQRAVAWLIRNVAGGVA